MTIYVTLQRVSTGETRKAPAWYKHTMRSARFWWLEGNGSCDCNRTREFLRAAGPGPVTDPHHNSVDADCGNDQFRVLQFEENGVVTEGDKLCPGCNNWNTCYYKCPLAYPSK